MADADDKPSSLTEGLTEEQKKVLAEVLPSIESRLFFSVLKRLRAYLLVVLGTLTLLGGVGILGVRDAAVELAAKNIAEDDGTQQAVVESVSQQIEDASGLLEQSQELAANLERENARAAVTMISTLDDIHEMLRQLREEVNNLSESEAGS